jgi:ABC-type iron transport system FetAB ATPase subunit
LLRACVGKARSRPTCYNCSYQRRDALNKALRRLVQFPGSVVAIDMSRQLTLPDALFEKLEQGAAQRGLTIATLLDFISELILMPEQPTACDYQRSRRIEQLLDRYRAGPLAEQDRAELDALIDTDFQEAIARADRRIAAKQRATPAGKRVETSAKRSHQ